MARAEIEQGLGCLAASLSLKPFEERGGTGDPFGPRTRSVGPPTPTVGVTTRLESQRAFVNTDVDSSSAVLGRPARGPYGVHLGGVGPERRSSKLLAPSVN